MSVPDLILDGPAGASCTIALAHGAGAPMDSAFMAAFAEGLAGKGFRVARFEFPYMAERRTAGKKKPPNRMPVLMETWAAAVAALGGPDKVVVGGKSMGGRVASLLAADLEARGTPVKGLVCLGYPFHPPGKPENTRVAHLETLKTPTLICQGERDSLGNRDDVAGYTLSKAIALHWLGDGDHGFKPRKKSGLTEDGNWAEAVDAIAGFVGGL